MNRVIFHSISLERFLRLPEAKPALEYLDGEVIQKVSPKRVHSVLQVELVGEIRHFSRGSGLGRVYSELRCTFGGNSLVSEVCFITSERLPRDPSGRVVDDMTIPPDLWIEILSPGQTVRSLSARIKWCMRQGVRLGWLVQPRKERVYVFEPEREVVTLHREETLDGGSVLPGFRLDLASLFDEVKK